tara:strand:- start:4943 stop:5194 length:252 start_codon:yes stop_codon:yes gene_type:complete
MIDKIEITLVEKIRKDLLQKISIVFSDYEDLFGEENTRYPEGGEMSRYNKGLEALRLLAITLDISPTVLFADSDLVFSLKGEL